MKIIILLFLKVFLFNIYMMASGSARKTRWVELHLKHLHLMHPGSNSSYSLVISTVLW